MLCNNNLILTYMLKMDFIHQILTNTLCPGYYMTIPSFYEMFGDNYTQNIWYMSCQPQLKLIITPKDNLSAPLDVLGLKLHGILFDGLNNLTNLRYLTLESPNITKLPDLPCQLSEITIVNAVMSDLSSLRGLHNLTALIFKHSVINDVGSISSCVSLTKLDISDASITDLNFLTPLINLTKLNISRNNVSDADPILKLHYLIYINITDTGIDKSTLEAMPNLHIIWDIYPTNIS